MNDSSFYGFLKEHGVGEPLLEKMKLDKVNSTVVKLMTDDDLKLYLPCFGHRVLAKKHELEDLSKERKSRKEKLLGTLLKKVKENVDFENDDFDESEPPKKRRSNSEKSTRRVQLGWLCFDVEKNGYKQVREKQGGGTRCVEVPKYSKKSYLLEKAVGIFIGDDDTTDLDIDLLDFQQKTFPDDKTVSEMFNETKLSKLRFYLATCPRNKATDSTTPKSTLWTLNSQNSLTTAMTDSGLSEKPFPLAQIQHDDVDFCAEVENHTNNESVPIFVVENELNSSSRNGISFLTITTLDSQLTATTNEQLQMPIRNESNLNLSEDENLHDLHLSIDDCRPPRAVIISHANVMGDLINEFLDPTIMGCKVYIQRTLANGEIERGADGGGVSKDTLSAFWSEFYDNCTLGRNQKVPILRHDFDSTHWAAVARIIVFGYIEYGYWPVMISPIIFHYCFFIPVEDGFPMVDALLSYVSEGDELILKIAWEDITNVDMDNLIDVLDNLDCRTLVSQKNIQSILREIAHKQVIQEPMFVLDCWQKEFLSLKFSMSRLSLKKVYSEITLTDPKQLLNLLEFPDVMSSHEHNIAKFLKQYIRGCDLNSAKWFLRFCTGSDLLLVPTIHVEFRNDENDNAVPLARTCGSILELPTTYKNFVELRAVFNNIMRQGIWVMDVA